MRTPIRAITRVVFAAIAAQSSIAFGHGFVGDRFFPPTVTTDDPFATDELALPTVSYFTTPADPLDRRVNQTMAGFEFDKEILPHFALGISDNYLLQKPQGQPAAAGWDNVSLTAKYQLWQNPAHEAIVSLGMETDLGGSGTSNVGGDRFNTYTPILYFGKGLGDLPDALSGLKPLALTGTLGQSFPARADVPESLQWGIAVEYSIPYLQQHIVDLGIPAPWKNMIPLVEFAMDTPENRGPFGPTTGTINPGVLLETRYFQLGAEALIPINGRTGPNIGAVVQAQIYIDDLFPTLFGHPLFFGENK